MSEDAPPGETVLSGPPGKHEEFRVVQEEPLNGGPPVGRLSASYRTPLDLFFVRNHGPVPAVDREGYRLTIAGLVERPLELSLPDLRSGFPRAEVPAALQCAGNRRREMAEVAPIPGELLWGEEAVGQASWGGVPLAAVLAAAGPRPGARHVAFTGLDEVERRGERFGFGGSIPLEKALAPEVLLADEMNGASLPALHGAPLRVVVPGYIGARSVKWLASIRLQEEPSANYFQSVAYRLFPPGIHAGNVRWEEGHPIGEFPVNAAICRPGEGAGVSAGRVPVEGYALAGGGRGIVRVDLSADGGATWTPARLQQEGRWSWALWRGEVDLPPGEHELAVRAWDAAGQTQPETVAALWNFKGYLSSAWHRVRVRAR